MTSFGKQMLQAEGAASVDGLQDALLSHMVASRGASSTAESFELLSSGLDGMGELTSGDNGGEETSNGNEDDGDGPSSKSTSSMASIGIGIGVGVGAFATIAMVAGKKRCAHANNQGDVEKCENR